MKTLTIGEFSNALALMRKSGRTRVEEEYFFDFHVSGRFQGCPVEQALAQLAKEAKRPEEEQNIQEAVIEGNKASYRAMMSYLRCNGLSKTIIKHVHDIEITPDLLPNEPWVKTFPQALIKLGVESCGLSNTEASQSFLEALWQGNEMDFLLQLNYLRNSKNKKKDFPKWRIESLQALGESIGLLPEDVTNEIGEAYLSKQ